MSTDKGHSLAMLENAQPATVTINTASPLATLPSAYVGTYRLPIVDHTGKVYHVSIQEALYVPKLPFTLILAYDLVATRHEILL